MTREEAKKALEEDLLKVSQFSPKMANAYKVAISALSENKGEWIPVSERLPEKNRAVLTYVDTGASKTYCLAYWDELSEGWEEWIGYRMLETEMGYKVLAWQPLPEPYKAEKGGE